VFVSVVQTYSRFHFIFILISFIFFMFVPNALRKKVFIWEVLPKLITAFRRT
jgi:hypothetical protein